jgi:hypothetical protein
MNTIDLVLVLPDFCNNVSHVLASTGVDLHEIRSMSHDTTMVG